MRSQRTESKDIQPLSDKEQKMNDMKLDAMLKAIKQIEEERSLRAEIRKECE